MQICIDQCIQQCILDMASSGDSAEPNWEPTNKKASNMNYGITIRPGSKISIRAIGNIVLGNKTSNPDLFINAQSFTPNSYNTNWDHRAQDVRGQQSLNISFSGKMYDGTNNIGAGTNKFTETGNTPADSEIFNGVRRLITYLIPHPSGYDFNASANSEESGSKNVPLLSDPLAWGCSYTGSDQLETFCESLDDGYTSNNYTEVDDQIAKEVFPITAKYRTAGLGTYGGILRWEGDGIGSKDSTYDPFASTSCTALPCDTSAISNSEGRVVGDLSSQVSISNPTGDKAYKVSFKSINSDTISACNIALSDPNSIEYFIVDENDIPVHQFENVSSSSIINFPLSINSSSWTTDHITLEPGHKIKINNVSLTDTSCGGYIVARFIPYHEIEIHRSGLARFAIIDGTSGSCSINARIINPEGSHSYATFSSNGLLSHPESGQDYYEPDFYEYGNFTQSGKDPLQNLSVNSTISGGWDKQIFLRQGQKIRFSPESWNGTFGTSAGNRKCGTALAMHIIPKPALLCRGKSVSSNPDKVTNPACAQDYASESFTYNDINGNTVTVNIGDLIGCRENQPDCDNPTSTNYCPLECKKDITCSIYGNENNNYAKSSCVKGVATDLESEDENGNPVTLTCDTSTYGSACTTCEDNKIGDLLTPAKVSIVGLDNCYDLNYYKGKVSNIPSTAGFIATDYDEEEITKGATKIPFFNGSYGNFEEKFYETGKKDGNNYTYAISSPLFFSSSGRLKFFVLDDNTNFNDSDGALNLTSDNSVNTSAYNGSNGFKISTSSMLSFSNGQWMEVALCQETSNDSNAPSTICKTAANIENIEFDDETVPIQQSRIVEIDTTTSTPTSQQNSDNTKYAFDDYGNLVRTATSVSGDCSIGTHGVDTVAGNYFYCHTYQYNTIDDFESLSNDEQATVTDNIERLRLSFKIYDPEVPNCNKGNGSRSASNSTLDGIIALNNYYDSTVTTNTNSVCNKDGGEVPGIKDGECQKEYICTDKYSNNSGSYLVNIKVKSEVTSGISNIIGEVVEPIIQVMDGPKRNCSTTGSGLVYDGSLNSNNECVIAKVGQAERIYKLLINDSRYQAILNIAIVLMFTFFGMTYLMGVSELSQTEIITRVFKIGIIYLFVSPTGWDWFNSLFVRFFKGGSDHLAFLMASSFDSSPEIQSALANADYYDKSILFGSVDRVFGIFFSDAVLKKVSALLFASIFGWAYLLIVLMSFVLYVYAVSNAVLLYLTAQIFMSILFTLGPIFFIFILFSQTKEMFDNWLKQLIGFSLQQILILTTLAFFNMLMYEVIKMALGYKICWDEVWTINIITRITLLSFWTIASLPPVSNSQMEVGNIGNPDGIPSIFTILFIWVIASLMNKFIGFMSGVAADISGGISASSLGSGVASAVKQATSAAKQGASKAWQKTGGQEAMRKLDMTLFDSGVNADKRRDSANRDNKIKRNQKAQLEKGGKNAVEAFKKENAVSLNKMSETERQKTLDNVRNQGISAKGKSMGLNDDQIEKLKNSKGLDKYHGSNVFGAAAQFSRQAIGGKISGDSTISQSMGSKSAETSFSAKEFKDAAKNMTKEQRSEMKDNFNLDVKRSSTGKALRAAAQVRDKIKNSPSSAKTALDNVIKAGSIAKQAVSGSDDEKKAARANIKSSAGRAASSASGAVGGAIKSAAKAAGAATGIYDEDKNISVSELEKEGRISRMRAGTGGARSKEDDKLVKERMKENKKQQNPDKAKDIGGRVDAKMDLEYLNDLDDAKADKSSFGRANKIASAMDKRFNTHSQKADLRNEAKEKHNDDIDRQLNGGPEVDKDGKKIDEGVIGAKNVSMANLDKAKDNIAAAQATKAQKLIEKEELGDKDPNKAQELDKEIQEQDDKIDANSETVHRSEKEIKNHDIKIAKLNGARSKTKAPDAVQSDSLSSDEEPTPQPGEDPSIRPGINLTVEEEDDDDYENSNLEEEKDSIIDDFDKKQQDSGASLNAELDKGKSNASSRLAERLQAKKDAAAAAKENDSSNDQVVPVIMPFEETSNAEESEEKENTNETTTPALVAGAIPVINPENSSPKSETSNSTEVPDAEITPDTEEEVEKEEKEQEEPAEEKRLDEQKPLEKDTATANAIRNSATNNTFGIMNSALANVMAKSSPAPEAEATKEEDSSTSDKENKDIDSTSDSQEQPDTENQDDDTDSTNSDSTDESRPNIADQLNKVKDNFTSNSNSAKTNAATDNAAQQKSDSKNKASNSLKARLAARAAAKPQVSQTTDDIPTPPPEDMKGDVEERPDTARASIPTQDTSSFEQSVSGGDENNIPDNSDAESTDSSSTNKSASSTQSLGSQQHINLQEDIKENNPGIKKRIKSATSKVNSKAQGGESKVGPQKLARDAKKAAEKERIDTSNKALENSLAGIANRGPKKK